MFWQGYSFSRTAKGQENSGFSPCGLLAVTADGFFWKSVRLGRQMAGWECASCSVTGRAAKLQASFHDCFQLFDLLVNAARHLFPLGDRSDLLAVIPRFSFKHEDPGLFALPGPLKPGFSGSTSEIARSGKKTTLKKTFSENLAGR